MRSSIILLLLVTTPCRAQDLQFVYPVPGATEFTQRKFIYKGVGETGLSLDLFLPTRSAPKPLPVFVIFNGFGGEFMRTSPQSQGWAKAATAHGFAAVAAETTPDHVAEDFDSLVVYLRKHAEDLRVDPEKVVVIAWSGNVSAGFPA